MTAFFETCCYSHRNVFFANSVCSLRYDTLTFLTISPFILIHVLTYAKTLVLLSYLLTFLPITPLLAFCFLLGYVHISTFCSYLPSDAVSGLHTFSPCLLLFCSR